MIEMFLENFFHKNQIAIFVWLITPDFNDEGSIVI